MPMPSGPASDAFRYAHEHYAEVAWLSQNTNHLVPPEVVRDAVEQALNERRYEGYPYGPGLPELKERVREDLGLPTETQLSITSGGTEALYMSARALLSPGDEVVASDPSYLIIHRFIELSGARALDPSIYSPPYRLTSELVNASVGPKTKMVLLIDPLNPLGSSYPREEVRAIAEIAHDRHLALLNDVTYRDFADRPTLAAEFAPDETITIWSVSKNCGMAGLRLGGLAGPEARVREINRYNTNDLGVNILAQFAALAALRSKATWFPKVRATTRANQETIRSAVARVPGATLPVFPSQANMMAVDIAPTGVAPEVLEERMLKDDGVFVRAGNYLSPRFGSRFIRVSFSNPPKDVERFAVAFPKAMAKLGARVPAV